MNMMAMHKPIIFKRIISRISNKINKKNNKILR